MSLTVKQKNFCQCIVSGMTGIDSYRHAYDTKGKDSTVAIEAGRLLSREDIQEYIETLNKPIIRTVQSQVISEREKKKSIIWERIEACIASGDDSSVARYMDILNKMDAEYININKTIEDKQTNIQSLDSDTLKKLTMTS